VTSAARDKGMHVCAGVAERLPFADGSFPRIILVDTFHHLEDQRSAMRELLRVLVPGGRLVIEEPDIDKPVVKFAAFLERVLRMRSTFFSRRDMLAICQTSGAEVVQVDVDQGASLRLVLTHN
jgi:ubiquinone/menaquinone biosynthesis C-methylase UbiE